MKTKSLLILLTTALSLSFMSCEDQETDNSFNVQKIDVISPNQSRVFNYTKSQSTKVLKSAQSNTFAATIPDDAIEITEKYKPWQVKSNQNYYLPAGKSFIGQLRFMSNVNYYIAGRLTLSSSYGNSSEIYVMDGGTLAMSRLQYATVYSNGELELGNNFILSSATLNTYTPLSGEHIKLENGASIEAHSTVSFTGLLHLTGAQWANGKSNYSNATFKTCCNLASAQIDHNCSITVDSYMNVLNEIDMTSGQLYINDNALVSCALITAHNASTNIVGANTNYAVLDADKIKLHNNTVERIFYGLLDIHAKEIEDNGSGSNLAWAPEIKMKGDTYIASDGCRPQFGENPSSEKEYILRMLASLSAPNERISATSICFEDEHSYVSWHEKGAPFQGYIDYITYNSEDDTIILNATYYSSETDFNHIYKGDDIIYTACDNYKTGAMIGEIGFVNGSISLKTNSVPGSSANWIEKIDHELYVVAGGTEGAFSTYDINSKEVRKVADLPYAKSIFTMDEGYGILYNVLDGAKVYNTSNENTFDVGAITPENGKNASFTYENKVYVAQGSGGLGIYTTSGENINNFVVPTAQGGDALNCVYVDADYIYLAYGTAGIFLLNHDLEEVLSYKYNADGASANFIRKEGDLIYVSYGLSGVHVLETVEVN